MYEVLRYDERMERRHRNQLRSRINAETSEILEKPRDTSDHVIEPEPRSQSDENILERTNLNLNQLLVTASEPSLLTADRTETEITDSDPVLRRSVRVKKEPERWGYDKL